MYNRRTALALYILIVQGVTPGQHALMEYTGNQDAARLLPVEHDVPAVLHTA